MKYQAIVNTSCHPELPSGTIISSDKIDNELGYTWMTVQLSNGVSRDVIVKDLKIQGEKNDQP